MFYVYEHIRNDTNECFYVGKGTKKRCSETHNRNPYWKNVVKKAGGFTIQIVEKNLLPEQAIELEIKRIAMYQELGAKLTNMTAGGDGFSAGDKNPAKRPEVRKLLSENVKGDKNPFKRDDVRKRISGESHHMKTEKHKERMSKNNPHATPIRFQGVIYASIKQLSEATGVNPAAISKRLCKNPEKWGYQKV